MNSPKTLNVLLASIAAASAVAMIGCAARPFTRPESMVPTFAPSSHPTAASKTLRIAGPTEGDNPSLNPLTVGPGFGEPSPNARIRLEDFDIALQNTLKSSGLFQSVSSEGKADYELRVSTFNQWMTNLSTSGWNFSATIAATYELAEAASGKEIWRGYISSGCKGFEFQTPANECAVRANLSRLVMCLAEKLSGAGGGRECATIPLSGS